MKDYMLLFDLDGTLWDSAAQVAESWNIVVHKYYPQAPLLTAADINAVMGQTMDDIAKSLFNDMEPIERAKMFRECEQFEIAYIAEHGGTLYEGVEETLQKLQEAGYRMGIVSNCQVGYIDAFFQSMKLKKYFCDSEEWGRTKLSKAQNIRLVMERNHFDKAVYIGDMYKDQEAAIGAGVPFILADYGFGDAKEPQGIIETFAQLPACVEKLTGGV